MFSPRFRFWLVVGLLASNLGVGVFSLYFLRSVNERYAALFERSVPVVNSLRTITRELSFVQRLARRIVDPSNESAWKELIPQMDDASNKARARIMEVSNAELFHDTPHSGAMVELGRQYDHAVDQFLDLARAGRLPEANQFNNDTLRPLYDTLQLKFDAAADYVEEQSNTLRGQYAKESNFIGGLLLAFAGWPLLVAIVAVLVMALLVVTLLITVFAPGLNWSRRSSQSDPGI